ncbi:DUF4129 domain-containing protein [Bhargavaea cecembensis]|uniref:DUF4129 domain-containing protein n=1 Tax=Bhargavaea cecembensis TaxID=394098 RepID=UPI0015CF1E9B|nr:DUF4129 domain-containing protein [Bhargavaea cecembensis]
MRDWRMVYVRLAGLILEFSAVYLFSAPPYLFRGEMPPAFPMLFALLAGGAGFLLLRRKSLKLAGLVTAVLVLAGGLLFGLSPAFSAILGVVAAWRFAAAAGRDARDTEFLVAFLSIGYGLAAFFLIGGEAGGSLLKFLILQFGFAVFVRAARSVLEAGQGGRKQDRALIGLGAGVVLFTAGVLFLEPIMARLAVPAGWLFGGLGQVLGLIAGPFLRAAEPMIGWLREKQERIDEEQKEDQAESGSEEFQFPGSDDPSDETGFAAIFLILLAAGAAAGVFFLVRAHRNAAQPVRPDALAEKRMPGGAERARQPRVRRPPGPVRREVYRLERKMARAGKGRRSDEPFGEWLSRLGTDRETQMMLADLYSRVRYGDEPVSREEAEAFRKAIREIG